MCVCVGERGEGGREWATQPKPPTYIYIYIYFTRTGARGIHQACLGISRFIVNMAVLQMSCKSVVLKSTATWNKHDVECSHSIWKGCASVWDVGAEVSLAIGLHVGVGAAALGTSTHGDGTALQADGVGLHADAEGFITCDESCDVAEDGVDGAELGGNVGCGVGSGDWCSRR